MKWQIIIMIFFLVQILVVDSFLVDTQMRLRQNNSPSQAEKTKPTTSQINDGTTPSKNEQNTKPTTPHLNDGKTPNKTPLPNEPNTKPTTSHLNDGKTPNKTPDSSEENTKSTTSHLNDGKTPNKTPLPNEPNTKPTTSHLNDGKTPNKTPDSSEENTKPTSWLNHARPNKTHAPSEHDEPMDIDEENPFPVLPISSTTSLIYYFPYFIKTHLVTFADEVDVTVLSSSCKETSCSFCDPLSSRCMKCDTGYYLSGDSCVSFCPDGYISDTLRFKCINIGAITTEVIYTKAYSRGSCKNMCGKTIQDCSCTSLCKTRGNCCTDYDSMDCEDIIEKNNLVKIEDCEKNPNCDMCDNKNLLDNKVLACNQCKDKYYLHDGKCLLSCPEGTIPDSINFICNKKTECKVANCDECESKSNETCKLCKRGTFLYKNKCVERCPHEYRADRITWACVEAPVFAWYWVYPSVTSCKNICGVTTVQETWDCSCSKDCFAFGNCCQDIEFFCPDFLMLFRKNRKLRRHKIIK